jgi:hypothetical protein
MGNKTIFDLDQIDIVFLGAADDQCAFSNGRDEELQQMAKANRGV